MYPLHSIPVLAYFNYYIILMRINEKTEQPSIGIAK